jgi:hypothetical protein
MRYFSVLSRKLMKAINFGESQVIFNYEILVERVVCPTKINYFMRYFLVLSR